MGISLEAVNELEEAIDRKIQQAAAKQTRAYGEVSRIEADGTVYVLLDGAESDTPASANAAAVKEGERVSVTVDGGQMVIDGNYSAPATDDTAAHAAQVTANAALQSADVAANAAAEAQSSAAVAAGAATDAVEAAEAAQDSLKSVVQGATTVEKAVSVMQTALEAVIDYDPSTDTTQEWFWHDANGAHVLGDTSGYRNDITGSGMDIKEVSSEQTMAHFGADGALIGKPSSTKIRITQRAFDVISASNNGKIYAHIGDMRDEQGYVEFEETFAGTGSKTTFFTQYGIETVESVTVNGVATTDYTYKVNYSNDVVFSSAPANRSVIVITYKSDFECWSYTLGTRTNGSSVGAYSFVSGYDNEASGLDSSAAGHNTTASGTYSHSTGAGTVASGDMSSASGSNTTASGMASNSEGGETTASGNYSRAQNFGTKAAKRGQTALGTYNIEDTSSSTTHPSSISQYGTYAAIIGNGTDDSNRSNALAVRWDGLVDQAGETAYPTFIRSSWSTSSDESTLPVTPCIVLDSNSRVFYWCSGSGIEPLTTAAYRSNTRGTDLNNMEIGETWFGNNFTNAPAGITGYMQVTRISAVQIATNWRSGDVPRVYSRTFVNSVWSEWVRLDNDDIGARHADDQSSNVSVANTTWVAIASVELAAGVWILNGNVSFASNATGRRYACIHSASPTTAAQRQCATNANATSGAQTVLNLAGSKTPGSTTTYTLYAYQTSGSALNCTGYIAATRIK